MADISTAPKTSPFAFLKRIDWPWAASAIILALVAILDTAYFQPAVAFAAKALANTAPFIAFAVLAVAFLKATGAENLLAKAFEGNHQREEDQDLDREKLYAQIGQLKVENDFLKKSLKKTGL